MRVFLLAAILFAISTAAAQSPAAVEAKLLTTLQKVSDSGTYSGEYHEEESTKANEALRDILVQNGKRRDILQYPFSKLKGKMSVATSRDGKLRIYSWDMETGGTMHDHASVVQHEGASGKVYAWTDTSSPATSGDGESAPASGVGLGGYYLRIFQIDTANGPIYLANSLSIGCGQCHGQSLEAARIQGETLDRAAKVIKTRSGLTNVIDFAYAPATIPDSLSAEGLIRFNPTARSFSIPVVLDDESGFGRVTMRTISYKFNGAFFVNVR